MKERNIATCIILSILTCGIYGIYWFIVLTDDTVRISNGKEYNTTGGTAFLLTIVTCGIYGLYWYYQMGKSIYSAQVDKGVNASDNSVLYLILGIFGFGIVSYCLMQNELNRLLKNENA